MTISVENTQVDHNIHISSSINAVSNDICKNVTDEKISFGLSICANCGKESDEVKNTCNKCKQVKYCNAACKKQHRQKHKKQCEEHVRLAKAKLHDEKLFRQPPPPEDCQICFQRLPMLSGSTKTMACCGKTICSGCCYAPVYDNQGNEVAEEKCAFCRSLCPAYEEITELNLKRVETGDATATYNQGMYYFRGTRGFQQDTDKGLEMWRRAGELGYASGYFSVGVAYHTGEGGVEVDMKKAYHYYELAAMKGSALARANLGCAERDAGNWDRAFKHWMIAVRDGHEYSLKYIRDFYLDGHATKEVYTKALQSYQEYLGEIKSQQRDEAAAAHDDCRYY